jgi:hypothetical protein
MPRFKIGETVFLGGRNATVVWLRENANEIEAIDEYIVEFEDKQRQFVVSGGLGLKQPHSMQDGEQNRDACRSQTD